MNFYRVKTILRDLIFDFSAKFPTFGNFFLEMWSIFHKMKFMIKNTIQEKRGDMKYTFVKSHLPNILWLNPKKIDYYLENNLIKSSRFSLVLKGDWDLSKKLIKDSLVYKALKHKFIYRKVWQEIKYYNLILNQISKGIGNWGFISKKELDENLIEIESSFLQMKNKEVLYKENLSIEEKKELLQIWKSFGKIGIGIDRNGRFIVMEGIKSLLLVKILNIPIIPVHVNIRHKAWVDFKKKMYFFSMNYRNRKLYQEITHPDLQTIPFTHGDLRFNIIKENLSRSKGTLLDIGANLGYFSRKFEDQGFDCYAVEVNKLYIYFLIKLKKAENKSYKIIPTSIFNYKRDQELNFDVVLALNILHHFLKRKNTYFNLIRLLKRLKTKELYFEAHNPKEFRNKNVYKNYNPDEFVNFIIENSCLNKAKLLVKMNGGRTIYKLTAED